MPYLEMLTYLSKMDITVAPLELDNPFTEGKSELKIFEAALVKVPCVASSVNSYAQCITAGSNGFLASNYSEWLSALTTLTKSFETRKRIGEAAYRDFVDKFYFAENASLFFDVYNSIAKSEKRVGPLKASV